MGGLSENLLSRVWCCRTENSSIAMFLRGMLVDTE